MSTIDDEDDSPILSDDVSEEKEKKTSAGIVYLSKIPPYMKPIKMRTMFLSSEKSEEYTYSQKVNDNFAQLDQIKRQKRKKSGGSGRKNFTEGWIEFKDKKIAKLVARSLNNTAVGGKKRGYYCEDIWNIKYLPKFKWSHISEKLAYEKASREQRMRTEMAQARKEASVYIENVSLSKGRKAMQEKRKRKAERSGIKTEEDAGDINVVKSKYRQKTVVPDKGSVTKILVDDKMAEKGHSTSLDKSLLLKVFGTKE